MLQLALWYKEWVLDLPHPGIKALRIHSKGATIHLQEDILSQVIHTSPLGNLLTCTGFR